MLATRIHNNQSQVVDACMSLFYSLNSDFKRMLVENMNIAYKKDISLKDKFESLYQKWFEETCIFSNPNKFVENNNFKEIVNLGEPVVPFIIEKIKEMPSDLVKALNLIYNQRISEKKVSISEACKLWIEKLGY